MHAVAVVLLLGIARNSNSAPSMSNEDLSSTLQTTETICKTKQDGVYAVPMSDMLYYRCKNGESVEHASCDKGFYFSTAAPECLPNGIEVETICSPTGDGFFITPGTLCRGYYKCEQGAKTEYTCPIDSYFDMSSETCVRSGGVCYELVCSGRINGHYADTTHDCRRSYVCEGGTLRALFGCPHGMLYNGSSCIPASNVVCSSAAGSAVALKLQTTDHCTDLPDGFHTQPDESCRDYLLCHDGQTIAKLRCAPGEHFNGKKCAPASEINQCISYCIGKSNGYHTDVRKQCKSYVKCVNEKFKEHHSCSENMVFNGQECIIAELFDCPANYMNKICSKLKNGYHQDFLSNCKEYFYCFEGEMQNIYSCKRGQVFNGSECVSSDKFLCDGPEFWPDCVNLPPGLYPDVTSKSRCRYYHFCSNNKRIRLVCPLGKIFNGENCVDSGTFMCPKIEVNECQEKADGYYADAKSGCRSYFYCSNGNKQSYLCPDELIFDGNECISPTQKKCLQDSKECQNKSNGYHADVNSGCHMYIYCLEKIKIATFSCPPNEVFDGKRCTILDPKICTKTAESCSSQLDGYYVDPKSDCKKYFQCLDGKRTKIFSCPEGKIFNGTKCTSYSCPVMSGKKPISECNKTSIGFFQDFSSGCRNYFFCIDGLKTSLSCKGLQVFNGEICVDKNVYRCPTLSS